MQKLVFIFIFIAMMVSCVDTRNSSPQITGNDTDEIKDGQEGEGGDGALELPGAGGIGGGTTDVAPKVEIRHLIEPKVTSTDVGGTYTRKITIPKNYDRLLYLSGINVGTLASKQIKVRFRFGLTSEPITVPATVSTATGLTPQTDVEVLVMDLRNRPFENVQLIYDLFDYNDYSFLGSTSSSALDEPVFDNRNKNLFCRGLSLGDDPTFTKAISDGCSQANDICKYAYAKVVDKGLVKQGIPDVPVTPSQVTIATSSSGYDADTSAQKISRCLPDDPELVAGNYRYTYAYNVSSPPAVTLNYGSPIGVAYNGDTYTFEGPYRPVNEANWQITSAAIYNSLNGIFRDSMSGALTSAGIQSRLFPIAYQKSLTVGTQYVGSINPEDTKTLMSMNSNGDSAWMDGCNARAASVHSGTGEHIGSCSVTATIEIIAVDDDGVETVVDATKEVKMQLVKPATINADGENVLLPSFDACSSSQQCGAEECCFNKRCWDKKLVTQCIEDAPTYGNGVPGASCTSDFNCASLCCSPSTGKCAVHDTLQDPPVYCSKPSGNFCIAKEWCMKQTVTECFIVKTGLDNLGNTTCALRCYTRQEFGDCRSGICIPPPQPAQPVFNPSDPNRCNSAIDPPDYSS